MADLAASAIPTACRIWVATGDETDDEVVLAVAVVAGHLAAAGRGVDALAYWAVMMSRALMPNVRQVAIER